MSMSLWNIEQGLADLMEQREELLTGTPDIGSMGPDPQTEHAARLMAVDLAIAEYVKAEVRKVDNIRGLVKHLEMIRDAAKAEAKTMQERSAAADRQLTVLKSAIQVTMEEMEWREGKPRKLEGKTGSISLKGNGGRQPVVITDEALRPDECCKAVVTMPFHDWQEIRRFVASGSPTVYGRYLDQFATIKREVSLTAIATQLEQPCASCSGSGLSNGYVTPDLAPAKCGVCGGSGKNGVPGAILAPRGQHVEVK